MAGRDGRGPLGRGPLTGRAFGVCNEDRRTSVRQGRRAALGLGQRCGRGLAFGQGQERGFGIARQYNENTSEELLLEQKEILEDRLRVIKEELENL